MDKKSIKVEIYGAQYTLRASDEDETVSYTHLTLPTKRIV